MPVKRTGREGLVRRYVAKMTGLSRAQVTRLIGLYQQGEEVKPKPYRRHGVPRALHSGRYRTAGGRWTRRTRTLSGPATQKILQREFYDFGDAALRAAGADVGGATVPVAARAGSYRSSGCWLSADAADAGGDRRAAAAASREGRPGYLRVDTVHQGDLDGVKGVYHINAVDEVTQWQVVGATAQISEAWLMPVLEAMLEQFPFRIRGFHSDNGSEFINHTVARLLNKLLVEQTKSRPRHSQRQRAGGIQERSGDAQAHGLRPHCPPQASRGDRNVLRGALQSVSELSSAVRGAGAQ